MWVIFFSSSNYTSSTAAEEDSSSFLVKRNKCTHHQVLSFLFYFLCVVSPKHIFISLQSPLNFTDALSRTMTKNVSFSLFVVLLLLVRHNFFCVLFFLSSVFAISRVRVFNKLAKLFLQYYLLLSFFLCIIFLLLLPQVCSNLPSSHFGHDLLCLQHHKVHQFFLLFFSFSSSSSSSLCHAINAILQ